jgi:hypothetical protein
MTTTREMARADLREFFDDRSELGVEKFVDIWFSDGTQATLKALVERLGSR